MLDQPVNYFELDKSVSSRHTETETSVEKNLSWFRIAEWQSKSFVIEIIFESPKIIAWASQSILSEDFGQLLGNWDLH